jgi:predicted nucleotidyltransferase
MATAEKARIDQILAQIESLYAALAGLTGPAARTNPALYAVMAEGPREHIEQLPGQLEALVGPQETERLRRQVEAAVARPPEARCRLGQTFDQALRRLVDIAQPVAVVLFGSYAEDRAIRGSDVDLMVIAEADDSLTLAEELYGAWYDLQRDHPDLPPADILVFTPNEYAREYVVGFPAHQATLHGKVLYGRIPEQR